MNITLNRKARHEYTVEETYEAGIVLQGWEIKSIREGKVYIIGSYVTFKGGEAWLLGSSITPLQSASTHVKAESDRTRKLLLKHREIKTLLGLIERRGYTLIPLSMYWKRNKVKLELGLVKGKKAHDKRKTVKDRDWKIEKQRIFKKSR